MRPNIILIFADDLGIGDVSCFNPDAAWHTPNLDRLAAQGMRFVDSHATSSVCTPSRYALLTGRYNWRSSLKSSVLSGDSMALVEKGRLTIAQLLHNHGYRTAVVGKWHLGLDWVLREDGNDFATFGVDPEQYPEPAPRSGRGGYFNEAAKYLIEGIDIDYSQAITFGPNEMGFDYSFITAASLDQPPYVYIENGQPLGIPTAIGGDELKLNRATPGHEYAIQAGPMVDGYEVGRVAQDFQDKTLEVLDSMLAGDDPYFLYVPSHLVHGPLIPNEPWKGTTKAGSYGDFVVQLDAYVGQIMDRVDAAGTADDTIIIFTSDNGASAIAGLERLREEFGHDCSAGWRGHKTEIWEGGHREPFIVRWPSTVKAGSVSHFTVSHCDVLATVAEIIGAGLPDNVAEDSVSNLPLWRGGQTPVRDTVVTSATGGGLAITRGRHKLTFTSTGDGHQAVFAAAHRGIPTLYEPSLLFDLETDPRETTDLAAQQPQLVAELTTTMIDIIKKGRSTKGAAQPNNQLPEGYEWTQIQWVDKQDSQRGLDSVTP